MGDDFVPPIYFKNFILILNLIRTFSSKNVGGRWLKEFRGDRFF